MEDNDSDLLIAHQAAANGELETLSQAIQSDPALLEHQDANGVTPLGYAVKAEQLDAVKILVKMGASINCQDTIGRTCLSVAAYQGWYEGVRFLLRNGASQSVCDKTGRSPLHTATYCTDTNVIRLLLQNLGTTNITQTDDEDMTPLHWAAFHCRESHVKLLIERGVDVSLQDIDGKTALHWAAQNGSHECCMLLLEADNGKELINCRDNTDKTAMHLAAAAGHPAVLTVLAETEGCELDADDSDGRTPLHWAAAMGRTETLNVLLNLGVDPAPEDVQGHTPLDYARQSGHQDCISVLERRLGIKNSSAKPLDGRPPRKKTKLGFFAEFFRLKRDGGSSGEQRSPPHPLEGSIGAEDCRRNSDVSIDLVANHKLASLPRKRDHELLESISRLQISRSDNPCLAGGDQRQRGADRLPPTDVRSPPPIDPEAGHFVWSPGPANQEGGRLGRTSTTPTNRVLGQSVRTNHERAHNRRAAPPANQEPLLCSSNSPPMFRRDRSLSPGSSPMSLRVEANRAQLEEDAAQILALQLDTVQQKLSPRQGNKSPRPLDPIISPRGGPSGQDHSLSPGSSGSTEADAPREIAPDNKHGVPQLAPIRGSLPKVAGPTVNKRLHLLRQEKSGANRSPTPPGWNNLQHNCLPSGMQAAEQVDDNEGLPTYAQHKKKKKKSRLLQTHAKGQQQQQQQQQQKQHLTQQTDLSPDDPDTAVGDNRGDTKLEALTPRLGAVSKVRDPKEQLTFNRNIQTLLH